MGYYRLYTLSEVDGHFLCADELSAVDDMEAVRLAREFKNRGPMELWCGKRKITSFPEFRPELA